MTTSTPDINKTYVYTDGYEYKLTGRVAKRIQSPTSRRATSKKIVNEKYEISPIDDNQMLTNKWVSIGDLYEVSDEEIS